MKIFKPLYFIAVSFLLFSCEQDDNNPIDLQEDLLPPVATIFSPEEGAEFRNERDTISIDIEFEVTDDIEIDSIVLVLNGEQIEVFSGFKDYRRVIETYHYEKLGNGEHTLVLIATDLSGKTTADSVSFVKIKPYEPVYEGEIFYMPFDNSYKELNSTKIASRFGNPGFAGESVQGENAYAGAPDSYLMFPAEELLNEEFSAVFWIKLYATTNRAGLLVISPYDDDSDEDDQELRTSGFRFFREGNAAIQTFKLNVGTGFGDTWFDGGTNASVIPALETDWFHLAFTISGSKAVVYKNGKVISQGNFDGIDWTGCDILSIGSGAPRFTGGRHLSDESYLDELRIFNKALTQKEIQTIFENEQNN